MQDPHSGLGFGALGALGFIFSADLGLQWLGAGSVLALNGSRAPAVQWFVSENLNPGASCGLRSGVQGFRLQGFRV